MLYAILKPLMKAALRLYFGRIVLNGMEYIDNGRPTLIIANHTASFMDAVITACFVKRRIYFFTRGDVFNYTWADKLLRSLGMLPVYRLRDGRDKLHMNDSSNDEALKILAGGGAVLIFAEGESNIAKVLKPLKKGPFRLAATAAATLPEAPLLVPLGINYITPAKPFGDAFLYADTPVRTTDFSMDDAAPAKAATDMMRRAAAALAPLVWHVDDAESAWMGDVLLSMLKEVKPQYSFADSRRLLQHLNDSDAAVRASLRADWEAYHLWQRQHPVDEAQYSPAPTVPEWLLVIAGLPVAAIGLFSHIAPVLIAKSIADNRVKEPDFWAPVFLSCAVVLTCLYYALSGIAILSGSSFGRTSLILAAMALSGVFYLKVYRPVLLKALGLQKRSMYRRHNPSYAQADSLRKSFIRFVRAALNQ